MDQRDTAAPLAGLGALGARQASHSSAEVREAMPPLRVRAELLFLFVYVHSLHTEGARRSPGAIVVQV